MINENIAGCIRSYSMVVEVERGLGETDTPPTETKFVTDTKPEEAKAIPAIKTFFKAYVTSDQVRHIIENRHFTDLATNPVFSTRDFRAVPEKYRALIPEYIKDYVSLNQFTI